MIDRTAYHTPRRSVLITCCVLIMILPAQATVGQAEDNGFTACARQMTEHFRKKGWVGITPKYDDDGAIFVVHVFADSPADKAGIRKGDYIRGINGNDRKTAPKKFLEEYDSLRPNRVTVFDLEREGGRLSVDVLVDVIPESTLQQWIREECQ